MTYGQIMYAVGAATCGGYFLTHGPARVALVYGVALMALGYVVGMFER